MGCINIGDLTGSECCTSSSIAGLFACMPSLLTQCANRALKNQSQSWSSAAKSASCSSTGPKFGLHHPHGSSQMPVTPVPGTRGIPVCVAHRHTGVQHICIRKKPFAVYFQIPDRARVAPSSSDPKFKFFELIKVNLASVATIRGLFLGAEDVSLASIRLRRHQPVNLKE